MAFGKNDVNVNIGATDKTGTAFRSAETKMKRLAGTAKSMAGMLGAGIGVAALTRMAKSAIDYGSAITDAAAATRVGIEEYQILKFLAQETGAGMDKMTNSIAKIQKATNDAANGLTTYTRAFEALGINVNEFQQLNPERQFVEIGRAVVNATDPAVAYASALDIIGSRNAPKLMEALKILGTDGWDAVAESAKKAGQVMSEETAQKMDKAADSLERFKTKMTIATATILTNLETSLSAVKSATQDGWEQIFENTIFKTTARVEIPKEAQAQVEAYLSGIEKQRAATEEMVEAAYANMVANRNAEKQVGNLAKAQNDLTGEVDETTAALIEQADAAKVAFEDSFADSHSELDRWVKYNLTGHEMLVHSMKNASDNMTDSFMEFTESGKINFSGFVESMMKDIARMTFQQSVANPIAQGMTDIIGSAFGSSSTSGTSGGGSAGWFSGLFGGRAEGGPVLGGRSYLVGERGPEIMTTKSAGTVIPNDQLGGGETIINFNVTAIDSASFSQHLAVHRREITGIVESAYNRRGRKGPLTT